MTEKTGRNLTEKPGRKRGCGYWVRLLTVGSIGGVLLACTVVEVVYIHDISSPAVMIIAPATGSGVSFEPVTIVNSSESISLAGWYVPSQNGAAVILLHGYGANRLEMVSRAEILARHGFGVLLYDLRGHGESGGSVRALGWPDDRDVEYAIRFLENRKDVDPDRIGILGFSVGGMVAIRAAAEYARIRAIIADDPAFVTIADASPPDGLEANVLYSINWLDEKCLQLWTGIAPPPGIAEVIGEISPRPILLIGTGEGPVSGSKLATRYFELAGEPKSLWLIPEARHGGQVAARPQEYEERMIGFFSESLACLERQVE